MRPPILITYAATALLIGCGSAPPGQTSGASPRYQADYASCDKSVPGAVNKRNAKTALAWFASPVTRWFDIDDGMNGCMQAKGWGITRPCTDEERRRGNQAGSIVVTARGISCVDPGRAS